MRNYYLVSSTIFLICILALDGQSVIYKKIVGSVSIAVPRDSYEKVTLSACASLSGKSDMKTAFNFFRDNSGNSTGTCQILAFNKGQSKQLVAAKHNQYFYEINQIIPDPCTPNPCIANGMCSAVLRSNGIHYSCECIYPFVGDNCENSTVKLQFDINSTAASKRTWLKTYDICRGLGKRMVMDKDEQKHKFIVSTILQLFPPPTPRIFYWVGLNRTTTTSKFKYVDGTVYDKYIEPFLTMNKSDQLYVAYIHDINGGDFMPKVLENNGQASALLQPISICEFE